MRPSAVLLCTAAALGSVLAAAPAAASPELAQARLCVACHGVSEKKIGPSYQAIAARYAGQPDAVARMAEKIRRGSSGAWGAVPMPANPKVTPDEARQLAAWLLVQKK
jgi:cytochrome c